MVRSLLICGLALTLCAACSNDGTAPSGTSRLGRYRLSRINGAPLPAFVTEGSAARIDFVSGAVHLKPDGTFIDSTEVKVIPFNGEIRITIDAATGTYRFSNDTVHYLTSRNERYFMVYLSERAMQQELAGSILLYVQ